MMLTIKALHKQLSTHRQLAVALLEKCVILPSLSDHNVASMTGGVTVNMVRSHKSMWLSLSGYVRLCEYVTTQYGPKLYHSFLPDPQPVVPNLVHAEPNSSSGSTSGSHLQPHSLKLLDNTTTIVDSFLAVLLTFIISCERVCMSALAPPSPLSVCLMPQVCSAGLLEGEELVQHLLGVLPAKVVKFSGYGSSRGPLASGPAHAHISTDSHQAHHVCTCVESNELLAYIQTTIQQFTHMQALHQKQQQQQQSKIDMKHLFSKVGRRLFVSLLQLDARRQSQPNAFVSTSDALHRMHLLKQIRALAQAGAIFNFDPSTMSAASVPQPNPQTPTPTPPVLVLEASVLLLMAVTGFVRELFHGQPSVPVHGSAASAESVLAGVGGDANGGADNASNDLANPNSDGAAVTTFKFENAGGYVMWLLEAGLLRSGAATGHGSGLQATSTSLYYTYADPWEVR